MISMVFFRLDSSDFNEKALGSAVWRWLCVATSGQDRNFLLNVGRVGFAGIVSYFPQQLSLREASCSNPKGIGKVLKHASSRSL